jgi:hypothetical protein
METGVGSVEWKQKWVICYKVFGFVSQSDDESALLRCWPKLR